MWILFDAAVPLGLGVELEFGFGGRTGGTLEDTVLIAELEAGVAALVVAEAFDEVLGGEVEVEAVGLEVVVVFDEVIGGEVEAEAIGLTVVVFDEDLGAEDEAEVLGLLVVDPVATVLCTDLDEDTMSVVAQAGPTCRLWFSCAGQVLSSILAPSAQTWPPAADCHYSLAAWVRTVSRPGLKVCV